MPIPNSLRDQIINALNQCEGWCSNEKAIAMAELIVQEKPKIVVELGVFGGKSIIPQALALKYNGVGKIYGIDPWKKEFAVEGENDKANDEWWEKQDLHNIHRLATEAIWKNCLDDVAIYIRAASQYCVDLFSEIDILHVDGDHSELTSCRDVENYFPKVRRGGFVWMDDANWPTTQKAVGIVAAQCDELLTVENGNVCKLFRKKL